MPALRILTLFYSKKKKKKKKKKAKSNIKCPCAIFILSVSRLTLSIFKTATPPDCKTENWQKSFQPLIHAIFRLTQWKICQLSTHGQLGLSTCISGLLCWVLLYWGYIQRKIIKNYKLIFWYRERQKLWRFKPNGGRLACLTLWCWILAMLAVRQRAPKYSRTSVARTLMARLPQLFRIRPQVHWKKSYNCKFTTS